MHRLTRIPVPLRPYLPWLGFCLLAGLVFAAYYPGLHGPFLLDDWGTLPSLGAYGPVNNWNTFVSYVTSGIAGISGRPVSLASFLLDAHNWPANPWPFKLTNVLLQLVNGALLAWLLAELSRYRGMNARKAAWVGVLAAGVWMAHPLFVSTTLYVVQRMAMLAAFFVFLGLIGYVAGRRRLNTGRTRSGYAMMLLGVMGGGLAGFFSKENGALLPLLALVLEFTVLRNTGRGTVKPLTDPAAGNQEPATSHKKPHPAFMALFLWLPSALILGFLLWQLHDLSTIVPPRDFSVGTRLLTEARILAKYLYFLVIPHAWTHGLYTVVPLSHGFLHPWTTLPAIVLLLALLVGAFRTRRRWPVFAAAILFFFAGQLLESTTIPLELYYEHRNYLPAALLFWPLALWWVQGMSSRSLRWSSAATVFIVLLTLTGLRTSLWGDSTRLALTWMRLNPDSARAIVVGTDTLESQGRNQLAYRRLYLATRTQPDNISLALARLDAACRLGGAHASDVQALVHAAAHDRSRLHLLYETLSSQLERRVSCPGLGTTAFARILASAEMNPHYLGVTGAQQKLGLLQGQLNLANGDADMALIDFEKAVKSDPSPAAALTTAAYLLNAGHPRKAQALISLYSQLPQRLPPPWSMKGLHRRWLDHIGWYRKSFRALETSIRESLKNGGNT